MKMPQHVTNAVRDVVRMLVNGDYSGIERVSGGRRLSAQELKEGVEEYGRTLVMPPEQAISDPDAVQVENVTPPAWGIRLGLWTVEEGRSDLTLEVTVGEQLDGGVSVQVDDLHVL